MITILEDVLKAEELSAIHKVLKQGQFYAGAETAGWAAKSVKNNQQWQATPELESEVTNTLTSQLVTHPEFSTSTYAKKIAPFLISQSQHFGGYGNHVDDALMSSESILRSDLSCTLFLSNPEDYEGGELVFSFGAQQLSYKLPAGHAIIYPSTSLHQVTPVTQGVRHVAVTWMESYVRSSEQREILQDLDNARREIIKEQGKNSAFDKISKSHANLLRLWAET